MLTIFAMPKPFTGHTGIIQRNAIESWTRLTPRPEVILIGDEEGTAELCAELGLRHIPELERNEFGTPVMSGFFAAATRGATHDLLCYVNADLVLTAGLMDGLRSVTAHQHPFMLVGGRWGLQVDEPLDFDAVQWEDQLRVRATAEGQYSFWAIDYFAFTRGLLGDVPPFAVGRGFFDGWLIWRARARQGWVVDASPSVFAVHQNHDYGHLRSGGNSLWTSTEGERNFAYGGQRKYFFLLESTHQLTPQGLKPTPFRKQLYQVRTAFEKVVLYRLGPLRHALGLRRSTLAGVRRRLASLGKG